MWLAYGHFSIHVPISWFRLALLGVMAFVIFEVRRRPSLLPPGPM